MSLIRRLFTPAAYGGLRSAPASLPRGAHPHLRQSILVRACYLLSATLGTQFVTQVSSPGEPPPQALSEPYVRLSPHTAPSVQPPKHPDDLASRPRLLLRRVGPVRAKAEPPTHLRSSSITEPSSLLRASLPPCPASVLWLSRVPSHLSFSLRIGTTGSHVPRQSLIHVHAAFMPHASRALNRDRKSVV